MTADARVTAWLDRLEAELPPATPKPFWQRCGCLSLVGEIPSVDYCHQAGLCAMRERDRERDEAARSLLALARGVAALADELEADSERAYQRSCGRHYDEGSDGQFRAYGDAADRLRDLLADAAPDTGEETA